MHPSDTDVLAYHVRRLDGDTLVALVVDLWAARGYETTREGDTVVATRGATTLRVLIPRAGDGSHSRDAADLVVTAESRSGHDGDTRTVDAAGLAEALSYAVDQPVARGLCRRHLGAPPGDLPAPPLSRVKRRAGAVVDRAAPAPLIGLVVAVALVGLLAAGTVSLADGTETRPADGNSTAVTTPGSSGATDTVLQADADAPADSEEPFPSSAATSPPGVTTESITDLEALAAAHERTMATRSHTVWLDRHLQRLNADDTRVQYDIDMTTEGDQYLVRTTQVESGDRHRLETVYHDGAVPYRAAWNETAGEYSQPLRIDPRHDVSPTPQTVRRTLVWQYLATAETTVTDRRKGGSTVVYRVVGTGAPDVIGFDHAWNYTAVALVDARGFVRNVTVEFSGRASSRVYRTRHEITYDRIGSTTVDSPRWYDRRVDNATAG